MERCVDGVDGGAGGQPAGGAVGVQQDHMVLVGRPGRSCRSGADHGDLPLSVVTYVARLSTSTLASAQSGVRQCHRPEEHAGEPADEVQEAQHPLAGSRGGALGAGEDRSGVGGDRARDGAAA